MQKDSKGYIKVTPYEETNVKYMPPELHDYYLYVQLCYYRNLMYAQCTGHKDFRDHKNLPLSMWYYSYLNIIQFIDSVLNDKDPTLPYFDNSNDS